MRENSPMRRNLKATRTACRVGARFDCFRARDGVQLLAEYCAVIMPFFIAGVLVSTVVNLSCISTADSGGCSSCCRRCCCAARLQRWRSGGGVCCCLRRRGGVGNRSTRRNIMSKRGASRRYQELVPSWMWVGIRRSALMSISARSSRMRLHLAVTARPATLCGLPCGCLRIVRSACGR